MQGQPHAPRQPGSGVSHAHLHGDHTADGVSIGRAVRPAIGDGPPILVPVIRLEQGRDARVQTRSLSPGAVVGETHRHARWCAHSSSAFRVDLRTMA
jgi:hypothetical protein